MSAPNPRDKAYSLLTEHWNVYEDVNDILDDLLDIGIDQPEADSIIEGYKTEMHVEVPIAPKKEATNKGTLDDIFLNTGTFPYTSGNYKGEQLPPEVEKERQLKQKPPESPKSPEKPKAPEGEKGTSKKFGFKQDDGVVILGKRGSGKTNLIRFLVKTLKYNFVILDSVRNLSDLEADAVAYHQLNSQDTKQVNEILESALEEGDLMVVIDEIDRYKTTIGTKLNDLVNLGRNYGVGYLSAARRTARIDKDVLAGATWSFVFKHILPQDLEVLTDWFAVDESVFRDLGDHEVILMHNDQEVWRGTVKLVPGAPEHVTKPPEEPEAKEPEPSEKEPEEPKEKEPPQPSTGEGAEPEAPPEGEPAEAPPEEGKEEAMKCEECGSLDTMPKDGDYQVCFACGHEWVPNVKNEGVLDTDRRPNEGLTCPNCGNKNVHYEGGQLVCPSCGYRG